MKLVEESFFSKIQGINTPSRQSISGFLFFLFRFWLHINLGHTVRRQQIISGQNDRLRKITFTKDSPILQVSMTSCKRCKAKKDSEEKKLPQDIQCNKQQLKGL